jgi:hypothetical protein
MLTVTIAYDGTDREAARRAVESAGFTVTRIAAQRAPGATVARIGRASALVDMPHGLDKAAQAAYVRGYATGCHRYTRKHGAPSLNDVVVTVDEEGRIHAHATDAQRAELARLTRAHEWDRHPTAHRAGMKELNAYLAHPARTATRPLAVAS